MTALIGLISGFAFIGLAVAIGGSPAAFVNATGLLIVLGGTAAVTAVSFSPEELVEAPKTIWRVIVEPEKDPAIAAMTALRIAERTRKEGTVALKKLLPSLRDNPFLSNACQLVLDGASPEEAESILRREADAAANRYRRTVDVLHRAGEVAPAMGLIGTLIGLVQMLGRLEDPASIGPAMAVALLTTLYGAMLAHMVFLPLAAKAERVASEESLQNTVYAMAAASIGRRENPRRLEMLINTLLPPAKKVAYFK